MNKIFLIMLFYTIASCFFELKSQVTLGALIKPDTDALLDIKENADGTATKGMLLPRVKLVAVDDPRPLDAHVEGMVVYNISSTNSLTPGMYVNNGSRWLAVEIPDNGKKGQVLMVESGSLLPQWRDLKIPKIKKDHFNIIDKKIFSTTVDVLFSNNSGPNQYRENDLISALGWESVTGQLPVSVVKPENRIILIVQILLELDGSGKDGWVSYAGGLFLDSELKSVRVGRIDAFANEKNLSKTETLFFILENMSVGTRQVEVAFIRRNSDGGGTGSELKVSKGSFISLQYSEKD